MKLRVFLIIGLAGMMASCFTTEPLVVKNASVEKVEQGKEFNDYAVSYALPKTVINVEVLAEKTITKPGPFAAYAERFLGVTNVPTRESSEWKIKKVALSSSGQRDPEQVYRLSTEGVSKANRIQLDYEGVILGVNMPPFKAATYDMSNIRLNSAGDMVIPSYPDLTIRKNTEPMLDTSYQLVRTDTSFLRLPILQQQVSRKTLMNQAEEAANLIMKLRERRFGLLNGEYAYEDIQMPMPEGRALEIMIKELAQLEYDYVSLFVGRQMAEIKKFQFSYIPGNTSQNVSEDLFTFSTFSGVLPAGNSNGDPVELVISPISGFPGQQENVNLDENEGDDKGKGLAYRIPGLADISVQIAGQNLLTESILIAQYGTIQFLPKQLLSQPDVMIRIHPELGSLEGIYEK